jgi:superfamily II helicase
VARLVFHACGCQKVAMATHTKDNVDYRLLNRLNKLVICSRCLRQGRVTPIPQVFSSYHRPRNVCDECRDESGIDPTTGRQGHRRKLAKVLQLRP